MQQPGRSVASWVGLFVVVLTGCVSDAQKKAAVSRVNETFKECYEQTIRARGSHRLPLPREQAMARVVGALERLGMTVTSIDAVTSAYVRVQAPAPLPLSDTEWRQAVEKDLPMFRSILGEELGPIIPWFLSFEPEGLDIAIRVSATDASDGTDLHATMRMVERAPPPSGWPRREYPPCTALERGVDKLWRTIDQPL